MPTWPTSANFLCAKYPNLTAAEWQMQFGITAADESEPFILPAAFSGRTFDYRGYLARNGWDSGRLTSSNPLAVEPGVMDGDPTNGTFTNTYLYLVYWQDIIITLRNYARQKNGREIYITSNGTYPFQAVGLFDYNSSGPGGSDQDFCLLTRSGDLDGTQSLLPAFLYLV